MLSSLVCEFLDTPVVALDTGSASHRGLLCAAGAAFALGAPLRTEPLFAGRSTKPFALDRPLRFFANPASSVFEEGDIPPLADAVPEAAELAGDRSPLEVVTALVAARCELPSSAIGTGDHFLSDLHLTSIAVGVIATEAARTLGRPPLVAPSEFADATVIELAEAIGSDERVLAPTIGVAGVDAWVRPFAVTLVERGVPRPVAHVDHAAVNSAWQCFAPADDEFARTLERRLGEEVGVGGVLLHLPRRDARANLPLLLAAAKAAFDGVDARLFVMVHHGDAGVAVARTLHQEARSLATRIVETPEQHPEAVDWVIAEARAAASYLECQYDERGARRERRLRVLPSKPIAEPFLPLSDNDVLLVTGGGKGIAAECGLALARESGCALGIVGRSKLEATADAELRENLARLAASGVRSVYASADVADGAALGRAIEAIESELGPITGLLHAAGLNAPKSLSTLDDSDFARTLAPKLDGLEHLLERLEPTRLRCVLAFGSIIAQLGLPGEADYAWANELLARRLERYAEANPDNRCLCLEWSIWSGVGMGERLGRVEALAAQNISAISPDEGTAWLLELLARSDLPVRVFLSGRFGGPPTLALDESEIPLTRYLERIREHVPGVELVADAELSFATDPYLADHVYADSALLPGVMGLEAMAQVARALAGDPRTPIFERVRFRHPIEVAPEAKRTIRVAGLLREDGRIELVIRSDASEFQVDHMLAEIRFDDDEEPSAPTALARSGESEAPQPPGPALEPERDLYGDLFFQRGRFARVKRYHALRAKSCDVEIGVDDAQYFGAFLAQRLLLGDAGARDAAVHAIQACVPHHSLLPVGVDRIRVGELSGHTRLRLVARERWREAGVYVYDFAILDEQGAAVERWEGLRLQEVAGGTGPAIWPAALLAPRLEELAADHFADAGLRAALVPGRDRAATERGASIAESASAVVRHRPDGKPELDSGRALSASHADDHTLVVTADAAVACDIESVAARPEAVWRDMLGPERHRLVKQLARARRESIDSAATRLWGAQECLRKLGLQHGSPLVFIDPPDSTGDYARLHAGHWTVLSLEARIRDSEAPVVITLMARGDDAGV